MQAIILAAGMGRRLGVEVRQAPPSCQTSHEKQYDHFIDEIESHAIDE